MQRIKYRSPMLLLLRDYYCYYVAACTLKILSLFESDRDTGKIYFYLNNLYKNVLVLEFR